jgi:hypothetical protein
MKKNITSGIVIFLAIVVCLLFGKWKTRDSAVMSDSFYVSPKDQKILLKNAQEGDPASAEVLYQFYSVYEGDITKAGKWLDYSVNQNFGWALKLKGDNLRDQGKPEEGLQYLERACKQHYEDSCQSVVKCKEEISTIQEIDK